MRTKSLLFLLIFMALAAFAANAQTSYSCTYREYCNWNEKLGDYETECRGYEDSSLFVMNANKTLFTHTTEKMKSTYYVKKTEYREDYNVTLYYVVSDVGNEYVYIFDPDNKEIRCLAEADDYDTMIRFYVKAIF